MNRTPSYITEATTNPNDTQHNTIPSNVNLNTIPLSQPQSNNTTTVVTAPCISASLSTQQTAAATHQIPNKKNFEVLYHESDAYYVMNEYCRPISDSFNSTQHHCKFNRDCLVTKQKVITKGRNLQSTSPTVFTSVPATSKKNNYRIHDVRMLTCFSPTCKNQANNSAKVFHHVCFMHMLNEDETMEKITIESVHDKVIDLVDENIDVSCLKEFSINELTNLIFPFCGKRCYNYIINIRNKTTNKEGDSEYAISHSWDKDGSSKKKTSMEVLINWLTTEENCSSYFGGVDINGKTNGNRKETYHYHIRDLIRNENGKY